MSDRYRLARLLAANARSRERHARELLLADRALRRAQTRLDRAAARTSDIDSRMATRDAAWRQPGTSSAQTLAWRERQGDSLRTRRAEAQRTLARARGERDERARALEEARILLSRSVVRARILEAHHRTWLERRARERQHREQAHADDATLLRAITLP